MPLALVRDPREMRIVSEKLRRDGRRIAFVPTMGYLHQGHVSLLDAGRRRGDELVLSIFVNPLQFGPGEDLARYPRDLDGDLPRRAPPGSTSPSSPTRARCTPGRRSPRCTSPG